MATQALKWILITSITLMSTTLLMFVAAYIAIFVEAAQYYGRTITQVVAMSNTFNIAYLIISPLLFPILKRRYFHIVIISIILIIIGCVARYTSGTDYTSAYIWSMLVAIAHVPIITAPYGLLGLFESSQQGYASSIPLFVPTLGINFSILYGMAYVAGQADWGVKQSGIQRLNLIIAVVALISGAITIISMLLLKKQIQQQNDYSNDAQNTKNCITAIKSQFTNLKEFIILAACWGTILGMNWTYGGMFGIFLDGQGLQSKQIALIGLFANVSSALFSNLGTWISINTKLSNTTIIFILNVIGFLGSLFIQASSAIPYPFFHSKLALIVAIIALRAGFSSFVSLALVELGRYGSTVLVSSVFFYIANATNLLGIKVVDNLSNTQSLAIMSAIIWFSIFLVHMQKRSIQNEENPLKKESMQLSESEMQDNPSAAPQRI